MLAERSSYPLTASQWFALRFFARANAFSRTVSELATYQSTTRGTASQTIKSLEEMEYVRREKSPLDGRSSTLTVTEKGRKLVAEDPLTFIFKEIESLDEASQELLRKILRQLVDRLGGETRQTIGRCQDCVFLLVRRLRTQGHGSRVDLFCQCVGLPLIEEELDLLCTSFRAKS
jgi:DNA-binding MarR family transcriptional regulator